MGDRTFGTLYGAKSSLHWPVILYVFKDFDKRNAVQVRIQRGDRGSGHPLENHKYMGFYRE